MLLFISSSVQAIHEIAYISLPAVNFNKVVQIVEV